MRRSSMLVVLAVAVAPAAGCSWLFVEAPPEGHERMRYFDCTSSRAAPVLDIVGAGIYGIGGTALVLSDGQSYDSPAIPIAVYAGIAAADIASAIYGFSTTSECSDAKEALMQRLDEREPTQTRGAQAPGCWSDKDCKGDRICDLGVCVAPRPASPSPEAPAPTAPEAAPDEPAPPTAAEPAVPPAPSGSEPAPVAPPALPAPSPPAPR